jgi:hypothetical protein
MIFVWRALYGLPLIFTGGVFAFYRLRSISAHAHNRSAPQWTRMETVALAIGALWLLTSWIIRHWQLWPDLSH